MHNGAKNVQDTCVVLLVVLVERRHPVLGQTVVYPPPRVQYGWLHLSLLPYLDDEVLEECVVLHRFAGWNQRGVDVPAVDLVEPLELSGVYFVPCLCTCSQRLRHVFNSLVRQGVE